MVEDKRPTGYLGKLYDEVSAYSHTPVDEIERMAKEALSDGEIDERRYTILQHRVPLQGFEHESLKRMTEIIGISQESIRKSEVTLYRRLQPYKAPPVESGELLDSTIRNLRWRSFGKVGMNVADYLVEYLSSVNHRRPTVKDLLDLYNGASQRELALISNNQDSYEIIQNVLRKAGFEIPELEEDHEKGVRRSLYTLPWRELHGGEGIRVSNTLARFLNNVGKPPTIENVLDLFDESANSDGLLLEVRNYGPRSLGITYEVFREAGWDLPRVDLRERRYTRGE